MSKRDMILVERVTDGVHCERAGTWPYSCHVTRESDGDDGSQIICGVFGDELSFDRKADAYMRCPACLATPSAVVLTAEMVEAVNTVLFRVAQTRADLSIDDSDLPKEIHDLRAAFTQVAGKGGK